LQNCYSGKKYCKKGFCILFLQVVNVIGGENMNDKIKNLIVDIRRKQQEWIRRYFLSQEAMQKMAERTQQIASELLQEKARTVTLETKIKELNEEIIILKNKNNELLIAQQPIAEINEDKQPIENVDDTNIDRLNIARISELLKETQYYISRIQNEHDE